jgi:hypothetical protein
VVVDGIESLDPAKNIRMFRNLFIFKVYILAIISECYKLCILQHKFTVKIMERYGRFVLLAGRDSIFIFVHNYAFSQIKRTPIYTATAIPFIYCFSGNSAASAPISTFLCL